MSSLLIINSTLINEGRIFPQDIYIKDGIIEKMGDNLSSLSADEIIDASGLYLIPGAIDDQVHFREPGLTHKGTIATESRAAVAGGITSFMEMPNTLPQTITMEEINNKKSIASKCSLANYAFYLGATNNNLEEIKSVNTKEVCGIKVFMGSSTGSMLVDNEETLINIFKHSPSLIATHCETESIIQENLKKYTKEYGDEIPWEMHPKIRSDEACFTSTNKAFNLAKETNARLHILHISTAKEMVLFDCEILQSTPLEEKMITNEVCLHHLFFSANDYDKYGSKIKWNPAIKSKEDQMALIHGLQFCHIDVVASDHAPHTLEEKQGNYLDVPSGGPMVQHTLPLMFELYHDDKIKLTEVINRTSHNVAKIFNIEKRGFIREGFYADLVLVDLYETKIIEKNNIYYKCGWSPLEGRLTRSNVKHTIVSGTHVYDSSREKPFLKEVAGLPLQFNKQR